MALLKPNSQLSQRSRGGLSCLEGTKISRVIHCPNNFVANSFSKISDDGYKRSLIFIPHVALCSRCREAQKFVDMSKPRHALTVLSEKNSSDLPDTCQLFDKFLRGNLHSVLGNYKAADNAYEEAMDQQQRVQSPHFTIWIEIYRAWNAILQEQPQEVYKLLYHNREDPTEEQGYSIQLLLAVADCLGERYDHAEQVLAKTSKFFLGIQDHQQACAAQLYLAYLYLQTERPDQARIETQKALTWLSQGEIDCLPHWWHPEVMGQVFAYAIAYSIQPYTAERIFIKYINEAGQKALCSYLYVEDVAIQRNCYPVYSLLYGDVMALIPDSSTTQVKQVIHYLLQERMLRPEGFVCLQQTLTTATQRSKPNAALIATFGLYIQRHDRVEIAEALDLSQSTIRNYITTLYEIFDLAQQAYDGQRARFRQLVAIAKKRGFIS